jgi:type II secretory pathway predicted ATPase ExeA
MYLQNFGLNKHPFPQEPDPGVFFPEAGRKDVLRGMRSDLKRGELTVKLIGQEGSGKTVLCQLLRRHLSAADFEVVYLDNPTGSFDELLWSICLELGMRPSAELEKDVEKDVAAELYALLDRYKQQGKKVLLLIDEAEKLFLAALERLFRILDATKNNYALQVVLVGSPALNDHIEQLGTYCSGVEIDSSYMLKPLTEEETGKYLAFRLRAAGVRASGRTADNEPLFTAGAVEKIFTRAGGVPGSVDTLAEAALRAASADTSSVVLPAHVVERNDAADNAEDTSSGKAGTWLRWLRLSVLLAVLAVLLLFCVKNGLLFHRQESEMRDDADFTDNIDKFELFSPGPETVDAPGQGEDTVSQTVSEITDSLVTEQGESPAGVPEISSLLLSIPQRPDFTPEAKDASSENAEGAITIEREEEAFPQVKQVKLDERISTLLETLEPLDIIEMSESDTPPVSSAGRNLSIAAIVEKERTAPAMISETVPETSTTNLSSGAEQASSEEVGAETGAAETLATAKTLPVITSRIVELTPGMRKTWPESEGDATAIKPPRPKSLVLIKDAGGKMLNSAPEQRRSDAADRATGKPDKPGGDSIAQPEQPEIKPVTVPRPVVLSKSDQLFQKLLIAGIRWKTGVYADKYTIQMLVLTSQDAAANIKKMIIRDEYLERREQLHILRRQTIPPTLFVCYGVYDSMGAAQKARNDLPLFLRKHHPYALSVADVLAKTTD